MKKITILTPKESWYFPHALHLQESLEKQGCDVQVCNHVNDLDGGDICFILSFDKMVPLVSLQKHRHNIVCHESDLPKGRGWSPMTWLVLEGASEIPVTMFEAADVVDSGVIYQQARFEVGACDLVEDLRRKMAATIKELCVNFVNNTDELVRHAQDQMGEPTYYSRRTPKDSEVDPSLSINELFRRFQVADNERYPVFFHKGGCRFILKCERVEK